MQATELHVRQDDLKAITAVTHDLAVGDGEALFRIELFALTANNVTYAAHGTDMAYWRFFPAPEGFGIVPVWGFASVVESCAEAIAVGERFYGYWPLASHALLRPGRVSPRGFTDTAPHRAQLPPFTTITPPPARPGGRRRSRRCSARSTPPRSSSMRCCRTVRHRRCG